MPSSITIKNMEKVQNVVSNFDKTIGDADRVFRGFVLNIFKQVVKNSPRDAGIYAADWDVKQVSLPETISAMKFINNMPYAGVLEHGSPVGGKPWPVAGKQFKKKGKLQPPKTVQKDGRVWSKQSPEPVAGTAVETADWKGLNKTLANILSKGLK